MPVDHERVAAELIQSIRGASGLSRAELARRAGIQPSVLSAYEHSRRQPSVAALARIAAAAGLELEVAPLSDEAALRRAGNVLRDVLELADRMPSRDRGELRYPPLIRRAA
jgi:transcriptional regulator with XRE-family HTH domain